MAKEVESQAKSGRCNKAKDLNQGMSIVIFPERTRLIKRMPCSMVLIHAVSENKHGYKLITLY